MNLADVRAKTHDVGAALAAAAPVLRLERDEDILGLFAFFAGDRSRRVVRVVIAGEDAGYIERHDILEWFPTQSMGLADSQRSALMTAPSDSWRLQQLECAVVGCVEPAQYAVILKSDPPPRCRRHPDQELRSLHGDAPSLKAGHDVDVEPSGDAGVAGLPRGTTTDDKHIAVWVKGQGEAPAALDRDTQHTLLIRVGRAVLGSFTQGDEATVPAGDIPEEGLLTQWLVSSRDVELTRGATAEVDVRERAIDGVRWYIATFELLVPQHGDSDIVDLLAVPRSAVRARLEATVYAKGDLYRELTIDLSVNDPATPPPASSKPQVDEHIVSIAAHLGLRPACAWQKAPARLAVHVVGRTAHVNGDVRTDSNLQHVDDLLGWPIGAADVAGLISNVRASAERFRAKRESYLNAIDREDLVRRLADFNPVLDWAQAPDLSDEAHAEAWESLRHSEDLKALAFDGHELYRRFFPANDPERPLRGWIDAMKPGDRLDLSWTSYPEPAVPHIPWGLTYLLDPDDPVDPLGFAGLRFRLAYRAYRTQGPISHSLGGLGNSFRANLLYWGGQEGDPAQTEADWQRTAWQTDPGQVFVPAQTGPNTKGSIVAALKQPASRPLSVLYLFCRCEVGEGHQVVLRFGSTTDSADVLQRFDLPSNPLDDKPLVFANACTTAASDPYYSNELERGFIERGARAFIGTETKVPIVLASRVAAVFFHFLGRGASSAPITAGEALAQTRLFLWTQFRNLGGLLYAYVNEFDLYLADETEVLALHD